MINPLDPAVEAQVDNLLTEFGKEYEWPYRLMKDNNRSPADQQAEAQARLRLEAKTALTRLLLRERVEELQGIRASVHYSDIEKHGGAHNKGFNRGVRWFHENIDSRIATLEAQIKELED